MRCVCASGRGQRGVRSAEPQDAAPDLVLPPLDSARLLFGPDSPLVPGAQAVPAGLLPLPLAFPGRTVFEWGGRKPTLPAKAAAGRFPAGP